MQDDALTQQLLLKILIENSDSDAFAQKFSETKKFTLQQRMDVYKASIESRLISTLQAVYPVCNCLIGNDCFVHLAKCHIQTFPNPPADLASYGEAFYQTCHQDENTASLSYLIDVCQLEWYFHLAHYQSVKQFDYSSLATVLQNEHDDVHFRLNRSATLMRSIYPVRKIWLVNQDYYVGEPTVSLDEGEDHLIILRKPDAIYIDVLNREDYAILYDIQKHKSLNELTQLYSQTSITELLIKAVSACWIDSFVDVA